MSNYQFSLYTDSSKPSSSDHRLVVIGWKTPQKEVGNLNYRKPPTICISIPKIRLSISPAIIAEAMQAAFEDLQNSLLRSLIAEKSIEQRVGTNYSDTDFDAAAVASWLAGSGAGNGRLSQDRIATWFDASVSEPLSLLLANRMNLSNEPSNEELTKLTAAITQRRTLLTRIAGPGVPFNRTVAEQLLRSVEPAEASMTKQQVVAKLTSYLKQTDELELSI